MKDSITNNGNHTGIGKILLDGTTQHQITGTGSFTNLQLNNSSNGINLDSNITINGVLTLTSGIITAPNDTLFISSTGSIARTSGHINGNLRKYFSNAADSLTFEIGNATSYLPVTVSFGTISANGNLTVQMVGTEHPDISNSSLDPDSTINRYWILNNNGIAFDKYNITVNWLNTDVDNGINDFSDMLMAIKSNGVWDELESGVITSTSMRGMNGTSFSSFAVGKVSSRLFTSVATGNWNTGGTWDRGSVPKKRDHVKIVSPHVVTLTDTRKISNVEIQSGAEFADGGKLLQMYGNFKFSGKWSGSGTIEWYDGSDTLSGSGGKATGTSTLSIQASNRYITATNDTLYKILIPSAYTVTNLGTVRATRVIGSVAGATWVNDVNSSLSVADTLLATGTLTATANGNTIIYNGTGAQSVKAANYKNLTISGARTTNSITLLTGTAGVSGVFTPSATFTTGNYITTSNTIDFNGTDAQAIPAFSYNNLTISGARTTNSVTLVSGDTIKIAGTFAPSATFTSGNYVTTNNWVSFNSAGAQTIPAFNYNSLKITGGRTTNNVTLASSDTIGVADSLSLQATFTTGKYIITGSKIAYNGTGKQNIVPFNYNNLSISGARGSNNVIFSPTGTVGVAGVLSNSASFSGGGLVFTNSTVDYNGTGAQTVPAFNYHHLTISGARTTNSVTLAPSTIGIAGTFSPTATFTTGNFVTTSNTISFNGSGAQNIPAFKYGNLGTATGGTKTATGTIRVEGDFTIGSSTTFNASTTTDTIYGNWTNSGTFTPSTSTIVFAGNSSSTISGSSTFNNLVMNKVDSATAVNLASNIQTANITMTKGTVQTGSNALTITTTRSGNGIIIGTVTRTHTFNLSTPYAFEGPNTLITFTAGTTPSSVTVTTTQTTPVSPSFIAVDRSFTIAMTGGSGLTTTLRLHYENSETNQLNEMAMDLWRHTSSWNNQNSTTNDSVNNYIELTGIATVTGDWAIGSSSSTKSVSDMNGGVTNAGDSLLYTITIKNPYKITKSSINVTDPINSYLIVKAGTISHGGGITGQTVNGNGSLVGGTVSWSAFSLASGDSAKRTFIVNSDSTMNVSELITNTASIDYGGSQIEYVTVPITITNVANIIIDTNIVSNSTPVPGDTLIYTLKYRNSGTSMAKTVGLTYTVPSNTSFVTNAFGSGKGIEINGVGKTNTSDGDEASISGLNITVSFTTLQPGDYKIVKFKTIVN
ncbi:MAG: hypothetical protein H3C35_08775 [Bacteroidetes bacterium]|nr:hypothetical protein [Bacteroidota bacterium]